MLKSYVYLNSLHYNSTNPLCIQFSDPTWVVPKASAAPLLLCHEELVRNRTIAEVATAPRRAERAPWLDLALTILDPFIGCERVVSIICTRYE